ncbi:MAG: DUF2892 domain-containing protein [Methanobrevibacter sp.]|nr:DUF2892 domain-containing protein [Methanobrevibacter sp.]
MIFTDLIYIFTGIGIIVGAVGALFLGIFGFCVLYELLGEQYVNLREHASWRKYKKYDEMLAVNHLNKLSKRYPELEITYNKK